MKSTRMIGFLMILLAVCLAGCDALNPSREPGAITGRVYLDEDADRECDECGCDFYLDGIEMYLYFGDCGTDLHRFVNTDEDGIFIFDDVAPGDYCVTPNVKLICEGYQPTTPIMQKVEVISGESVEIGGIGRLCAITSKRRRVAPNLPGAKDEREVPASRLLRVRPSRDLRDRLRGRDTVSKPR